MAEISFKEGNSIAKLFDMKWPFSGFVLDFSNNSFAQFFSSELDIEIYDQKYSKHGDSKGMRLRAFFELEDNRLVGNCIIKLVEHLQSIRDNLDQELVFEVITIANRLKDNNLIINPQEIITPIDSTREWSVLTDSILSDIKNGNPDSSLDRLHTYLARYFRSILDKLNIQYEKDEKIEQLYGKVRDYIIQSSNITEMSISILKSQTSIMQKYNSIRNNKSLAHPNELLNIDESTFIVSQILNIKKFMDAVIH